MRPVLSRLLSCLIFFVFTSVAEQFEEYIVNPDSITTLLTTYSKELEKDSISEIQLSLNFSKGCPLLFYEISKEQKTIQFTLVNTRIGGFVKDDTLKIIKKGPIKSVSFFEELRDKNEGAKMLKPELYWVTTMTINCDPVIQNEKDIDIVEDGNTISLVFPWPSDFKKRELLYSNKVDKLRTRKIRIILASVGAVGVSGCGFLIYNLIKNDDNGPGNLQPVLPVHQ